MSNSAYIACPEIVPIPPTIHNLTHRRPQRVIHRTASDVSGSILGPVVALLDGELRDVRTSPESPALSAGRVVQYSVSAAFSLLFPFSSFISRERASWARSTHLFLVESRESKVESQKSKVKSRKSRVEVASRESRVRLSLYRLAGVTSAPLDFRLSTPDSHVTHPTAGVLPPGLLATLSCSGAVPNC